MDEAIRIQKQENAAKDESEIHGICSREFFVESFFEKKEDGSACFLEETEPGVESKLCSRTLSESPS